MVSIIKAENSLIQKKNNIWSKEKNQNFNFYNYFFIKNVDQDAKSTSIMLEFNRFFGLKFSLPL